MNPALANSAEQNDGLEVPVPNPQPVILSPHKKVPTPPVAPLPNRGRMIGIAS